MVRIPLALPLALVALCGAGRAQTTVTLLPAATDTVFSGAQRTLYSNVCAGANTLGCAAPANYRVTWSTNCAGSIDLSYDNSGLQKFVRFTAPAAPATCQVTAVAADGSGASDTASFQVIPDAPTVSLVPFHITLYSGQYAVLQPEVFGTTNLNVKWSIAGPATRNVLTATSQQAVFMSKTPGIYVVSVTTAATGATGPATASAFVTVTADPMPPHGVQSQLTTANATFSAMTEPVDCSTPADPKWNVYDVYSNADLNAIDWTHLGTANVRSPGRGELIRVHYNNVDPGNAYTLQTILGVSSGVSARYPIRVCGVADPVHGLPVWSGRGARSVDAFSGASAGRAAWGGIGANGPYGGLQEYAVLNIIDRSHSWSTRQDPNGFIIVEGIAFVQAALQSSVPSGQSGYQYVAYDGSGAYDYDDGVSGVRVGNGHDIMVRGNAFLDLGNGMLTKDSFGRGGRLTNFLVQGNYFAGNGTTHGLQHQAYVEATGTVIQFNYFGHLRSGSGIQANALKTRCLRCYVRFNHFEEGSHVLDAVEPEDLGGGVNQTDFLTAMPDLVSYNMAQIAGWEEAYNFAYWFYGNTIKDTYSVNPILFGGDTVGVCSDAHIYLYNNSMWEAPAKGQYGISFVNDNYCSPTRTAGWRPAYVARNNIFWLDQTSGAGPRFAFAFSQGVGDRIDLANNWVAFGWCNVEVTSPYLASRCGNTVGVLYGAATNPIWNPAYSYQSADILRFTGVPKAGDAAKNRVAPFSTSASSLFYPQSSSLLSPYGPMPAAIAALPANLTLDINTGIVVPRQLGRQPLYIGAVD